MKKLLLFAVFLLSCFSVFAQYDHENWDSLPDKRILKIDFIAPLTGNFTVSNEQGLSKAISLDVQVGFIGIGKSVTEYAGAFGLFVKAGPCLYIIPNYETFKSKNFNRFQGTYVKPTLCFSYYSYKHDYNQYFSAGGYETLSYRQRNTSGCVLLNIGHQLVFSKILVFNFYGGIGYYIPLSISNNDDSGSHYQYGFTSIGSDFPIAIDGGIEIGLISKH